MPRERFDRLVLAVFKFAVRTADLAGLHGVLAAAFVSLVKEIQPDGSRSRFVKNRRQDGVITILILDQGRLRDDDKILAAITDFRCLHMSSLLRRLLLAAFVREPTEAEWKNPSGGQSLRYEFADPVGGSAISRGRESYRAFLRKFLPPFYARLGVRAVINVDDRYRKDRDISRVSSELGYPHVCLYREAMAYLLPFNYEDARARHAAFGKFNGDLILVQNEVVRQMFLDSGYADPDRVKVSGCTRMDGLLKTIHNGATCKVKPRPCVLYFTMNNNTDRRDGAKFDLLPVSRQVVAALAALAKVRADIDFVIRLKDLHCKSGQLALLQEEVGVVAGDLKNVPNLLFSTEPGEAHKYILASDVVCAMQSTTVLEAAVAGKPVIVPCFDWVREQVDARDFILYMDHLHMFDVPADGQELKRMVLRRLENSCVSDDVLTQRRALFERYVGPLAGGATERVADMVRDLVAQHTGCAPSQT